MISYRYNGVLCLLALSILVRWLVAQFPHSGQGTPPMFGDYEAQRHWMSITNHLQVTDWYRNTTNNDLQYWGLDYPPLTAYHMYLIGYTANTFCNASWTELHKSRGIETYEHKLFMRSTVILSDLLVYSSGVIYYFQNTPAITFNTPPLPALKQNIGAYMALVLLYPGQILIDHGHFQYNCVFMGLALWAIVAMVRGRQIISAFIFTLALNYKQMSLYYSLPFFWYIASSNLRVRPLWKGVINTLVVGLVVMSTFAILFLPYLSDIEDVMQVVKRLFPFNRGVFEDKVANFWFSLSIFYKYRKIYSLEDLLKASTLLTLAFSLPAGIHLLLKPSIKNFKYALINTSLVFFLMSFQVHEKTILVPALPILLSYREHPLAVNWFAIVSSFSLQPLLIKDNQTIPYFVLMVAYTQLSFECFRNIMTLSFSKLISIRNLNIVMYISSIVGCFILSIAAIFVKPPLQYPHIHPTINSLYSCAHFIMFLLYFYYKQFAPSTKRPTGTDRVMLLKKTK